MSYSFSVRGTSKAEVKDKAKAELDKVVSSQSVHAADRDQAQAAMNAFVDILPEPNSEQDVSLYVSGSLGWSGTLGEADQSFTHASISVQGDDTLRIPKTNVPLRACFAANGDNNVPCVISSILRACHRRPFRRAGTGSNRKTRIAPSSLIRA